MKPGSENQLCAIGLDVGGTKIAGGLVAFPSGRVLGRRIIPTQPERGGESVLTDTLELAKEFFKEAASSGIQVLGIGVGVCELVDPKGRVTSAQTIAWRAIPVEDRFRAIAPSVVESDVRAAALGEAMFGAGKPFKLCAYVTVGTGISSTLVEDGHPYPGARGNAIILASAPLSTTCPHCGARLNQVLEEFASGPALVARYNQCGSQHFARGEEVAAAAAANDVVAIQVVRSGGEALGNSVAFLVNILDPDAVIVGGGLGLAGGLYWESFVDSVRKHIWSDTTRNLPILAAALGTDAGIIGAAARLWQRQQARGRSA